MLYYLNCIFKCIRTPHVPMLLILGPFFLANLPLFPHPLTSFTPLPYQTLLFLIVFLLYCHLSYHLPSPYKRILNPLDCYQFHNFYMYSQINIIAEDLQLAITYEKQCATFGDLSDLIIYTFPLPSTCDKFHDLIFFTAE